MILLAVVCQYIGEIYLIKQIVPMVWTAVLRREERHPGYTVVYPQVSYGIFDVISAKEMSPHLLLITLSTSHFPPGIASHSHSFHDLQLFGFWQRPGVRTKYLPLSFLNCFKMVVGSV